MSDFKTSSLFAPAQYAAPDPAAIVRRYPFALLITTGPTGIRATSTPIFFEADESQATMIGHMARRNPQAMDLSDGNEALAVFSGPHAYISANWYREKPEVPTWNYVAAHVRGTICPLDDVEAQIEILRRTAAILEQDMDHPWTLEQAAPGRVETLLPMIRSFRIQVKRIDGVSKLSQSHPLPDRQRVIEKLLAQSDPGAQAIARLMMTTDC